ncbi:MAG: CAP domain-containing protein [Rhizomicrobium sp.]
MKPAPFLSAAACAFLLLFCAGCADLSSLFGPSKPDVPAQMPALESRIYTLIVDQRRTLDPKAHFLSLDPELVEIARKRSAEMALKNSFVNDDPHVSATMLMAEDAKFQGLIGENVAAQHFLPADGIDIDIVAKRFVDSWLASAPHKENLDFADYDRTGVGAAANGDTIYVTQLFSTDLGLGPQNTSAPPPQAAPVASPQEGKDDSQKVPLRGDIAPGG